MVEENAPKSATPTPISERITSSSEDSSTPIVPHTKPRIRKSSTQKSSNSAHLNIRQVFENFRRSRKPTLDSLDEDALAKLSQSRYDEAELKFLSWLDSEIMKIDEFYKQKEDEAIQRYQLLSAQLDMLHRLHENHVAQTSARREPTSHRTQDREGVTSSWVQKPLHRIRASFDGLSSVMPGADHQRRAKQPELMAHPISTATGYVEYRIARRRLKQAVIEFYRGMELLKGYRLLNRTGLTKILKKFDKTSGRHISPEYNEKLKTAHFDKSERLDDIMNHTEVRSSLPLAYDRIYMLVTLKGIIARTLLSGCGLGINLMSTFLLCSTSGFFSVQDCRSFSKDWLSHGNQKHLIQYLRQVISCKSGEDSGLSYYFSSYSE